MLFDMHECAVLTQRNWYCRQSVFGNEWLMSEGILKWTQHGRDGSSFTGTYYSGIRGKLLRFKAVRGSARQVSTGSRPHGSLTFSIARAGCAAYLQSQRPVPACHRSSNALPQGEELC
jgi:hypothetical protein